jgi:hypothetical protein
MCRFPIENQEIVQPWNIACPVLNFFLPILITIKIPIILPKSPLLRPAINQENLPALFQVGRELLSQAIKG